MRRLIFVCIAMLLFFASISSCTQTLKHPITLNQPANLKLPDAIRIILNKEYANWKFSGVSKEIITFFNQNKFSFQPNLLIGDFDGNGKKDYAVQINNSIDSIHKRYVIAFLNKEGVFNSYILEMGNISPETYLYLFKKGEKDYNYETKEEFQYKNYSIGVMYFEASGVSYIFEEGRFQKIISSD